MTIFAASVALAALTLLGCGGGGGSCGGTACGGDVVGTWKVTSSCFSVSGAPATCPRQTSKVVSFSVSGGVTYKADRTYAGTRAASVQLQTTLPASCLMIGGITVTCAQWEAALMAQPDTMSAKCTSTSSGCTCTGTVVQDASSDSGTWATAGNVLTETATGGQPDQSDYCAQQSKLVVMAHDDMTMPMMMGGLKLSASITLAQQ